MDADRTHRARPPSPLSLVAAVCAIAAGAPASAWAQADDNAGNGIRVDLSVLAANNGTAPFPSVRGGLLMPGPRTPVSQLHITSTGRRARTTPIQRPLRRPATTAARPAAPSAPSSMAEQRLTTGTVVPRVAAPTPPKPAKSPPAPLVAAKPEAEAKPTEEKKMVKAKSPTGAAKASEPSAPRTEVAKAPPPVMPEKPAVVSAPAEMEASKDKTSISPRTGEDASKRVRIEFAVEGTKLTGAARDSLAGVVTALKADPKLRLQLLAFAGGGELTASTARRLSLSRALAVRSHLIDSGIKSSRIDVRALGNKSTEGPPNRVDIDIVER